MSFLLLGSKIKWRIPPRVAVDRAWTNIRLLMLKLFRRPAVLYTGAFPHGRWQPGESDPEELTCFGLSYLSHLGPESCYLNSGGLISLFCALHPPGQADSGPNGPELQGLRKVGSPNCYLRFNGSLVHNVTVRQSDR